MTFDKALTEIEERLNAATPTPWELHTKVDHGAWFRITAELDDGWWTICDSAIFGKNEVNNGLMKQVKGNAELIANAPADIKKLLAVVKEMRGALNEVRKESLIQVPCPDGVVGCAVLHRKLDSRGKLASEALTKCDEIMGEE